MDPEGPTLNDLTYKLGYFCLQLFVYTTQATSFDIYSNKCKHFFVLINNTRLYIDIYICVRF